jgi:hypothetical protein
LRSSTLFPFVVALLLTFAPLAAHAVDLSAIEVVPGDKKIQLTVRFSAPAKTDVISHYQNNFVALQIAGMKFSADRTRKEQLPTAEEAAVIKSYRFANNAEGGEMRIYLVKPLTPADVLVSRYEDHLEIEILKPAVSGAARSDGKQGTEGSAPVIEPTPGDTAGDPLPADNGATPAGTDPGTEPATTEPADQLQPDEGTADNGGAGETALDPPADEPAGGTLIEPADVGGESVTPSGSQDDPAVDVSGVEPASGNGKSYKRFDLSKVQVAPVEIRGMPFREALMEMVAQTKFNVVVGEVADNSGVVLNFAQKPMSLKAALDLFCMAYDLTYTVEDDAIVIKSK